LVSFFLLEDSQVAQHSRINSQAVDFPFLLYLVWLTTACDSCFHAHGKLYLFLGRVHVWKHEGESFSSLCQHSGTIIWKLAQEWFSRNKLRPFQLLELTILWFFVSLGEFQEWSEFMHDLSSCTSDLWVLALELLSCMRDLTVKNPHL
jgi:hypothetical protein